MQRFVKRKLYIHRFCPTGGCTTDLPFKSNYTINIYNNDKKCLLWCLIAYLHPAPHSPKRVSNYNKPEYINEIKLPKIPPPYGYKKLRKIQELNKDKILFNVFNLNKEKTFNPVLINHNEPKGCNILYWDDNHYLLCKDVSFLIRKSSEHKYYPCLKCCVSFLTEHALNKHLDLCNTQKHVGRRTFHKDEYLKFDKFHYKNSVPFAMYYNFECIINNKNTLLLLKVYIKKSEYPDILEDKCGNYSGEDIVDCIISRVNHYKKLFKDIFEINIPLNEDSITPLTTECFY